MFMHKWRRDNRGVTLIELVIAVAILSIISMTIGGAMVVSTNAYRSGTTETALQQETQFTINTIESLIIDATDTVEYVGNVLRIKNTDYTYEIVYDSGAQTLRYSQYETTDPSNVVASDELLAEHVSKFEVHAEDFLASRNVRLTLGMTNEGKKFSTDYNITSRNDPNAGVPISEFASIHALDKVTLEPLQTYFLAVSVVGTTNTAYYWAFDAEPEGTVGATATVVPGGIEISIDATANGGADGLLNLWIYTDATDSSSQPLDRHHVTVNIRRVTGIGFGTLNLVSGNHLMTDAQYSLTGVPTGTNLEKVVAAAYETDSVRYPASAPYTYLYVDPNTIKWSFEAGLGENWADYIEILDPPGVRQNEVRFKLKKDIAPGKYIDIVATALHPAGMEGAERTNKTGMMYGTVRDAVRLKNDNTMASDIRRSTECYVDANFDYEQMIRDEWERNHPDVPWDDSNGYNGGYTGNVYFRYYSNDGTHKSAGYPVWRRFTDQGNDPARIKFNSADFTDMKCMKDYTLELCFSFEYNTRNNQRKCYPENSTPPSPDISSDYIYTFPMDAMSVKFDTIQDSRGVIQLSSYLTGKNDGIGTFANPIKLQKGEITIHHNKLTGAASTREEVRNLIQHSKFYRWNGSAWVQLGDNMQYDQGGDMDSGSIRFNTNNGGINQLGRYKIVLHTVKGETYANEPVDGQGGRGVIYYELVQSR